MNGEIFSVLDASGKVIGWSFRIYDSNGKCHDGKDYYGGELARKVYRTVYEAERAAYFALDKLNADNSNLK